MMIFDSCTERHTASKLQTVFLWAGVLLLAGSLRLGPAGLETAFAQNTPPTGQQIGEPRDADAGPMTDIHDIKPALNMGADLGLLIWLAVAVAAVAAVAAAVWWLWRRRKQIAAEPASAPIAPPEVEAYGLLDGLAAEDHGDLKRFYFKLSAILRRYVERRYGFPAAEMTTEELLPALGRLDLSPDLTHWVREFCLRSDPIKFAGAAADGSRVAHELAFVRDFVRQTTLVPATENSDLNNDMKAEVIQTAMADSKRLEYQGPKQEPTQD